MFHASTAPALVETTAGTAETADAAYDEGHHKADDDDRKSQRDGVDNEVHKVATVHIVFVTNLLLFPAAVRLVTRVDQRSRAVADKLVDNIVRGAQRAVHAMSKIKSNNCSDY
uniref:Uncharacterized protein n=1 Tax=Graphocephala atropunctata TaxID=36148 RepID=A0A1B6MMJ2_9HEMI